MDFPDLMVYNWGMGLPTRATIAAADSRVELSNTFIVFVPIVFVDDHIRQTRPNPHI
jgi:hypothetical protein